MPNFFANLIGAFKVDIRCDLSRNVFFPGNVIEGVVIVQARSPIDFRAIRLKLVGKEHVTIAREHTEWITVNGQQESRVRTEYHNSTAVVYKQLITLAGNMKFTPFGNGSSTYPMPGGTFYYPFSVQLPNDLPPSFSRRVGNNNTELFYFTKAYVDIPMGRDSVSKSFFTVLRPMPNSQWIAKNPVNSSRNFHVTCCCCIDKGYVKANIYMDRTVIAIDRDNLTVYADVDNTLGKEPVNALNVSLKGVMKSNASGQQEVSTWIQSKASIQNAIPAGGKGIIQGVVQLNRKAIPTYNAPLSSLAYIIVAELDIPYASNPAENFPVVVAQSIDESNYCAPLQLNSSTYTIFPKHGPCPEFYYQPPQQPVFQVNMIPMAPPPQQFLMPPPISVSIGIPTSIWIQDAAPIVPLGVKSAQISVNPSSPISWQVGFPQMSMSVGGKDGSVSTSIHSPVGMSVGMSAGNNASVSVGMNGSSHSHSSHSSMSIDMTGVNMTVTGGGYDNNGYHHHNSGGVTVEMSSGNNYNNGGVSVGMTTTSSYHHSSSQNGVTMEVSGTSGGMQYSSTMDQPLLSFEVNANNY